MEIMNLHDTSAVAYVLGDDINTDLHCSSKYLPGKSSEYVAGMAFNELSPNLSKRLLESRGGILIAGQNFGINSSREQAVHILLIMQVKGIIAKSFGRQFFRNAINNGLPILECDTSLIKEGDTVNVNFESGVVQTSNGVHLQSKALPAEILSLIQAGGLIPFLKDNPDWSFAK
jgi:3-isopropylmalate/(R)-2-methylmalate dehydratase small subunit